MTDEIATNDNSEDFDGFFDEFAGEQPAEQEEADESTEQPTGNQDSEEASEDSNTEAEAQTPDEVAELRKQLEAERHRFNSVNGRVNAYQRQIDQYKEQLAQQEQRSAEIGDNPQGSGMSDDKWNALKEDYPDIAEAMEAQLNGIRSQYETELNSLKQEVQPLKQYQEQTQYDQHFNSQLQALESQHPDWQDIVKTDDYAQWLETQPPSVQQLMNSTDAQDNIFLLNTFKATRAPQAPAQNPVTSKRERQLRQAQSIPGRSTTGGQSDIPSDDFEAAFNYYAEQG